MSGENVAHHQPENDGDAERAEGDGPADVGVRQAPTRPVEARTWKLVFKLAGFYWRKKKSIQQANPCIRSLEVSEEVTRRSNGSVIVALRQGFPYPGNFLSGQLTHYHLTRELRDGPYITTTLETFWESIQPNTEETRTQIAGCTITREIREGPHVTNLKTSWEQPDSQWTGPSCTLTQETREGPHITTNLKTDWTSIRPNSQETGTPTVRYDLTQVRREGPHITTILGADWKSSQPNSQETGTQTVRYTLSRGTREGSHVTTLWTVWTPSQQNSQGTEIQTDCHVTRDTRVGPYITTREERWRSPYIQAAETQAADYGLSRHIPEFELALTSLRTQSEPTLTSLRTQSEKTFTGLRTVASLKFP